MNKNSQSNAVIVAFVTLCVVWGTTYLGIKVAIDEHIPPFLLSSLRHLVAGAIFFLYGRSIGAKLPDVQATLKLGLLGVLMIVGGNGFVCWAEQFIPSGLTAVICSLSPMFITIMSIFAFKNYHINYKIIGGLLLGLVGIICIFQKSLSIQLSPTLWQGVAFLVMANLAWGFGSILMKKNNATTHIYLALGIQMLLGGIINALISMCFEDISILQSISMKGWAALLYLVVVGSLIGYGCYVFVLSHYTPSRISVHNYINTIIAVFVGVLIGGEPIDRYIILGTILVLIGVVIVNREHRKIANSSKA